MTVSARDGAAAAAGAAPAGAAEYVDDDKVQCPSAAHTTIQAGTRGIQVGQAGADVSSNTFGILMFNTTTASDPRAASRPSRLRNNTVTTNDIGIYLQDVRNQRLEANRVYNNGDTGSSAGDGGIAIAETGAALGGGNTLYKNDARTNAGDDCADSTTGSGTAGTGNTWTLNKGVDATPPPICTP